MKTLDELRIEIRTYSYEASIIVLNEFIVHNPESDQALTLRGMKHWGAGQRSLAIKDFLKALQINPQSKAKEALAATNAILDYRNKDLFNP